MILCVVTDRRRLGDFPSLTAAADALVTQARAAADAGLDVFQLREPDLPDRLLLEIAERARDAAAGSRLRVVINDRLDVALAARADGVHLRASSFSAARARTLSPTPFLIGRSIHSVADIALAESTAADAAGGLDYLVLGTVFPSRSKPANHALAGVTTVEAVVRACRLPILGIGGVTLENAHQLAEAGAAGLAAIDLFRDPRRLADIAARLRHIFATI